jgi:putative ferrous iron transport protein C
MILTDIKHYLQERGKAPLLDMSLHFDMEQDALRGLLEQWIRKGKVRKLPAGTTCSGCTSCDPVDIEIYAWVDQAQPIRFQPRQKGLG